MSAPGDHAAAVWDASRRQADRFREELDRHVGLLDDQMAVHRSSLARYAKNNMMFQVRRVERELRFGTRERTRLISMLAALDHRFPRTEFEASSS
jgi:hypothetical protein